MTCKYDACYGLTSVISKIEEPFTLNSAAFNGIASTCTLTVPAGTRDAYIAAGWTEEVFKGGVVEEDTDIADVENLIYVEETEAFAGNLFALSLKMKNTAGIRGFQLDVYLPEGVTAVKNNKGRIQGALAAARLPEDDEHTLTLSEQSDGAIRFLCGSQYDECFTGNDGEIATLTVQVAEDMEDGDYPLILRSIKLTETDISKFYETSYLKTTLRVASYIPGDINGDQEVDVRDYIGVANHISGQTPAGFIEKAADVNTDNVIDVSDYIGIANIIMYGSIYGNTNSNASRMLECDELDPQ